MSNFEHTVKNSEVNERLDKMLVRLNKNYSRHQIQLWIKNGYVKVNNGVVKPNYKCREHDVITWEINESEQMEIVPEPIPLTIVYEDESIIVLNKPKGMLVHPTQTTSTGTLVNGLTYYTNTLSSIGGDERPGIVHRLDQHTSGIMVVCKDDAAYVHIKEQFKQKKVKRIYETIVYGSVPHETGIIKAPIGRNPKNRLKMAVVDGGKESETRFRILGRSDEYTHVQCELITGRMHQIRVHMKYINHPVLGDPVYSRRKVPNIKTQALFAKTLGFIHPKTEQYVEFSIERPKQFADLLNLFQIKS